MVFFALYLLMLSRHIKASFFPALTTRTIREQYGYDVDYWCKNIDLNHDEAVRNLWEEKGVSIFMDVLTKPPNKDLSGPDRWPYKILKQHAPNLGSNETSGCGIIGSQSCDPKIDCEDMVKNGNGNGGPAYWAIQSLKRFHSKLNIAHECLQDASLNSVMPLNEISNDFTAPDNFAKLNELLSMLSTCFYMVGSTASMSAVAAMRAGAGVTGRRGAAQAKYEMYSKDPAKWGPEAVEAAKKELDAAIAAYSRMEIGAKNPGVVSAATYLLGSTFSLSTKGEERQNGQVEPGDLEPVLRGLFESGCSGLYSFGKLATGGGGDYSQLPHQNGSMQIMSDEACIGGFFSNGKWQMGDSSPMFNASIENAFTQFKLKLVDQAIQTASYQAIKMVDFDEEECKNDEISGAYFGRQWLTFDNNGGCWAL